jgi:hypothetical protein
MYIIIYKKLKKSTLSKIRIEEALQKVKIKNKTECTGFFVKKTNKLLIQSKLDKKKNNVNNNYLIANSKIT